VNFDWTRVGRLIICQFEFTLNTTTNFNSGTSTDNWRWSLPVTAAAAINCVGFAEVQQSTNARCTTRVTLPTTTTFSLDICSGRVDGVALANNGLVDAASPWTWTATTANILRGSFQYQAAS
jgi:hypothetical protein